VLNRVARHYRKLRNSTFRLRVVLPVAGVAALAVYLLVYASPQTVYLHDVALEIGGDLVGAIIIVAILTPLIARAREGRIRERGRLDYELFTDHLAAATSVVKILDTYSNLFDRPQTPQALSAIEQALGRHARVEILLLHPDSAAATVRAAETHRATIRQEILRNLRVLGEFWQKLDPQLARRFEVRLYTAAASTTHYRWDDRALISFLSLGRHTSQGSQLEIDVDTSLGHFVEQHFNELWQEAVPLDEYLRVRLSLTDGSDDGGREFFLPHVVLDEITYLAEPQVLAYLARLPAGGGAVAIRADRPDEQFRVQVVDDSDERLRELLRERFLEKYGWPGQAYLWLDPAPEGRRGGRRARREARS
jgi:hypothetical protein